MASKTERPIRVVEIRPTDHRAPYGGGGGRKVFGPVTGAVRQNLLQNCQVVQQHAAISFQRWPGVPGVAKVTLKPEALAKSHRPLSLFSHSSCPIIGTRDLGELLIRITPAGLDAVMRRLGSSDTKSVIANISAIQKIEPFNLSENLPGSMQERLYGSIAEGLSIKLRLFDHHEDELNELVQRALSGVAESLKVKFTRLDYPGVEGLYLAQQIDLEQFQEISSFIGLQSVSPMPYYRPHDFTTQLSPIGAAADNALAPPLTDVEYPVVGVIDSGICDDTPAIQPWIISREHYEPAADLDTRHGTMVGGLIAGARNLNHGDPRFPDCPAKLLDVAVFPKSGRVSEDDLIARIADVIPKYPDIKVWNLSLGQENPTNTDEFSDFARFLDEMHDLHGCIFIIASGNHQHLQGWPQSIDFHGADRVSSPGDSIRGLTVGSIANVDKPDSLVETEEPSPFSRRGPGPCFTPKPEVTHYGGNCNSAGGSTQTGVLSLGPGNCVMESVGTSFAAPIVSAQAAAIWQSLAETETKATPEKIKALLIHSALLSSPKVTSASLNHYGFGTPGDSINSLYCDQNTLTLMFEVDLIGTHIFERWPFPIPPCMATADGKFKGEILLTLAYSPPVNPSFASEYCRTNVEVSLGSYDVNPANQKREQKSKVPIAPTDIKQLYEKHRIEHGFKWSPVKAYRANFPQGIGVDTWRLTMTATRRAEQIEDAELQRAVVLVTLRSQDAAQQVYDQGIEIMDQTNWVAVPIDQPVRIEIE